jgi:hypothetical protein
MYKASTSDELQGSGNTIAGAQFPVDPSEAFPVALNAL